MLGMEVAKAREDNLRAVWFAAGAAVAVACLQRAAVAALVEQWRMGMFVALNLLLLAILFTSTSTSTSSSATSSSAGEGGRGESNTGNGDKQEGQKMEESSRKTRKERRCSNKLPMKMNSDNAGSGCREVEEVIVEDEEDEDGRANGLMCLSKEELNERVEAFIAMFRQQLISDAKNRSMGFHSSTAASAYNTVRRSSSSCLKN